MGTYRIFNNNITEEGTSYSLLMRGPVRVLTVGIQMGHSELHK